MSIDDDLEALLKASVAEAAKRRSDRARGAVAGPVSAGYRLAFTNPANWIPTGFVQLVHKDPASAVQTLVGLFEEFTHATSRGTRKLIATKLSGMNVRIEYVTQSHWISEETFEVKRKVPENKVRIIEDLTLDMDAFAPTVEVECTLVGGGISRVQLVKTTVFDSNIPKTFVELPAGMDVLEALTRDTKERIWREVKLTLRIDDGEEREI